MPKALLVIDMQKEGVYNSYSPRTGSKESMYNKDKVISNIKKLIKAFNTRKQKVIQVKVWITDPKKTSMTKVYPGEGLANKPGSEIIEELANEHFDYIVKKTHYSAFWKTNLDAILKKNKIKQVYLTGINTGFCVFCTALDAFYRGYDVFLVEDATSTVAGKAFHKRDVEQFTWFCGKNVISTTTLIKSL
ncbi:MAG: isochorismatase family cysteine hydrolase [Candidatus Woesearchaeota archaeon]